MGGHFAGDDLVWVPGFGVAPQTTVIFLTRGTLSAILAQL